MTANQKNLQSIIKTSFDILIGNPTPEECKLKTLPECLIDLKYKTDKKDVERAKILVRRVITDLQILDRELKQIVDDYGK